MKKNCFHTRKPGLKKVACTVSAAALMLGVDQAATIGLHFQENYCGSAAYSGFPVTLTAFGIAPAGWENLTPMQTGYSTCNPMQFYTLNEVVDATTSSGGLNPLPNGALNVTWSANGANFSGFAGYGGAAYGYAPSYGYNGDPPSSIPTGEWQIYSTFLRDGVNFGVGSSGGDNSQPVYTVDITGLKSVFTNTPYVIELIAASDSMQALTNAFIIDPVALATNSVTYPATPAPFDEGGTGNQWLRGHGGGLSTVSSALNIDHVQIMSNHPQHGGTGVPPTGFDNAGTISGFIITDKPVVTMSPQPVVGRGGDTITLNPYAIGVPPLAYQWRFKGVPISNATNSSYTLAALSPSVVGNYDLVVTNLYGSTTSHVAAVTQAAELISAVTGTNFVADSNPANMPCVGLNQGATWLASNSDGIHSPRSGVMQFVATNSDVITVAGTTNFDVSTGTILFWMRSAGTDPNASGNFGVALFGRPFGSGNDDDLILAQEDDGSIYFNAPGTSNPNSFSSLANVSDGDWHLVALTFDTSATGGATLYIDGKLDQPTSLNSAAWSSVAGQPIQIGISADTFFGSYDGLLDDVRFYSRQLSALEVNSVYQTGALVDTATLQMRLNFDTPPGPGFSLSWQVGNVILQSAPAVQGPYVNLPAAASPYNAATGVGTKFYRYLYGGKPILSNPFLM